MGCIVLVSVMTQKQHNGRIHLLAKRRLLLEVWKDYCMPFRLEISAVACIGTFKLHYYVMFCVHFNSRNFELILVFCNILYSFSLRATVWLGNASQWRQEHLLHWVQDLLWRDILIYRGRIDLDQCDIEDMKDGKGQRSQYMFKSYCIDELSYIL